MNTKTFRWFSLVLSVASEPIMATQLTPLEQVGKSISFDKKLSIKGNQSCAACHAPNAGWTGPVSDLNKAGSVYEGSISGRFGNRKPPSSAYATLSPVFLGIIRRNFLSAAIFGMAGLPARNWATLQPIKHKALF